MTAIPSLTFAQGSLENPVAGGTESGIGVISGWHCTASIITVTIDGASLGKAGSGTGRGDTTSICGRSNTGFSLLFNYNDLTPGSHTISAYADGQLIETRQFNTVQSGGASFVTGISKTATISDFPSNGRTATLQWSQAKQNFVVTGISGSSQAVNLIALEGAYSQNVTSSVSGSSCASSSSDYIAIFSITTSGNTFTMQSTSNGTSCNFNLTYVSGDCIGFTPGLNFCNGLNFSGSSTCTNGSSARLTFTGLKRDYNTKNLTGTLNQFIEGCTGTIQFLN